MSKQGNKASQIFLLLLVAGVSFGIGCCVGRNSNDGGTGRPLPSPPEQHDLKAVVETGMLSLVEAQFGFYAHVKQRERFAKNIAELGNREQGPTGMVLVMGVWNADYDFKKEPFHGYWFKIIPVENENPEDKKGFVIIALPDKWKAGWPAFITHIKNAKGGAFAMRANDSWHIEDDKLITKLRTLLHKDNLTLTDLSPFSSDNGATETIKEFKL